MAQIDDLNTAVANLQAAVSNILAFLTANQAPDLSGVTSEVQSAADQLNAAAGTTTSTG